MFSATWGRKFVGYRSVLSWGLTRGRRGSTGAAAIRFTASPNRNEGGCRSLWRPRGLPAGGLDRRNPGGDRRDVGVGGGNKGFATEHGERGRIPHPQKGLADFSSFRKESRPARKVHIYSGIDAESCSTRTLSAGILPSFKPFEPRPIWIRQRVSRASTTTCEGAKTE